MDDKGARQVLLNVWESVTGRKPTLESLQAAQAVARIESYYGQAWKGECAGSNNWGAVQAGRLPCGEGTCEYTDTHPNSDGSSTKYQICFRRYATPEDGAADMLRILFMRKASKEAGVLKAAESGDLHAFSAAMYATHYYEGFGPTPADRINNHVKALKGAAASIAKNLDEPLAKPRSKRSKSSSSRKGLAVFAGLAAAGFLLARK